MLDIREPAEMTDAQQAARPKNSRIRSIRNSGEGNRRLRSRGLKVNRVFTRPGVSPFDDVEWERRKASITDDKGAVVFAQDDVEVPKSWSMLAANVVASKYFYGGVGTTARETSVRQLIHRVARTIADWGLSGAYFASPEDAENFYNELVFLCLEQYGAFNSPVWFNVGLFHVNGYSSPSRSSFCWDEAEQRITRTQDNYKHPQASACFIQAVEDSMEDIMRLAAAEAMLFKYGSGTGTDLSTLRSSREKLSGGGIPSGPISFMRVFDQVAAVIKSGGKTRRAAKMQSLKVDHPDIMDFIRCKMKEEKKAWALIEQGYAGTFGGEAYDSVMFQNANLSVRVTDEFMQAVENDGAWPTKAVLSGETMDTLKAREVLREIAEATHVCGDPGLQYDSTINRWHTCLASGRINASNPCSEFMFLDNSACNLASLNLMRFVDETGRFDTERFRHAARVFIIAQDILVDSASYPTAEIAENSHRFRPLGLGYANLGALVMRLGLAYDSDEGRAFAGAVTALMTGCAYAASQEIARVKGPFDEFEKNRQCMLEVIRQHQAALGSIDRTACPAELRRAAEQVWKHVVENAPRAGFRNAQVTLLAPTGTIGFMMDCDTTGVEPDMALVKYKQLAGGGMMKIVNKTLRPALERLGYTHEDIEGIVKCVDERDTIEGAPHLKPEHLRVFDCAFRPTQGARFISASAHLRMMAAVQPFLAGAISKTINMPKETTVNEIQQAYMDGWKMGLKSVAIYRDGSKRTQPVSASREPAADASGAPDREAAALQTPFRKRMPSTRQSITHKFEVGGHEGYMTVGIYDDGAPGELFITMAKEGSTVGGTMDSFGTAISLCLQYGVPVQELCRKFAHSRFEPSGYTNNPDIPVAKSIIDYIFTWMDITFPEGRLAPRYQGVNALPPKADVPPVKTAGKDPRADQAARRDSQIKHFTTDAPVCDVCGHITVPSGRCHKCLNCGNSMGCS